MISEKIFNSAAFMIIKLLQVSSKLISKLYLLNIYVPVFSQKENNRNMLCHVMKWTVACFRKLLN